MSLRLLYEESGQLVEFPLPDGEFIIGRKPNCDICFPDSSVSKSHARLVCRGTRVELFDEGSRNGSVVNGEIVEHAILRAGDAIQIGRYRVLVDDDIDVPPPIPSGEVLPASESMDAAPPPPPPRRQVSFDDSGEVDGSELPESRPAEVAVASVEEWSDDEVVPPDVAEPVSGESDQPRARLVLLEAGRAGKVFPLGEESQTVGAREGNDIIVAGDGISRFHAEVRHQAGAWFIKDLGSRNGIYLDGDRVEDAKLVPGHVVQIGSVQLRFEPASNPLPRDLSGLLKDPRVRQGLAVAVVVAAVLAMFLPGGGPGPSVGSSEYDRLLVEGFRAFMVQDQDRARDTFDELKMQAPERDQARSLYEINEIWDRHPEWAEGNKFAFDWERGGELLTVVENDVQMPETVKGWAKQQFVQVKRDADAKRVYRSAEATIKTADGRTDKAEYDLARSGYLEAYKRLEEEIPRDSVFHDDAKRRLTVLKVKILRSLESSANKLCDSDYPPWLDIRDLFLLAVEFSGGGDKKRDLEARAKQMLREQDAEATYIDAYDIIELRQSEEYGKARSLLRDIPSDTVLYDQSQALLRWLDAETTSLEATAAYRNGQASEAVQLIDKILSVDVLAPDVLEYVRRRRGDIVTVARRFEDGRRFFEAKKFLEAIPCFMDVLKLERDRSNSYRQRAEKFLGGAREFVFGEVGGYMNRGNEALIEENYEYALIEFRKAKSASGQSQKIIQDIQGLINSEAGRILRTIKLIIFKEQRLQYQRASSMCDLLIEFLPPTSDFYKEALKRRERLSRR